MKSPVRIRVGISGIRIWTSYEDDHYFDAVRNNLTDWEPETQDLWRTLSRLSTDIVDVGAYFGFYSLTAHKEHPAAKIFAFEPNPNTYQNLLENLKENKASPLLQTYNAALGRGEDTVYLDVPPDRRLSSGTKISTAKQGDPVKQLGLDSVVDKAQLIKIDTEGFEFEILQGATVILKESKPSLILEILSLEEFDRLSNFTQYFGYQDPAMLSSSTGYLGEFDKVFRGPGNYFFPGKSSEGTSFLREAFNHR